MVMADFALNLLCAVLAGVTFKPDPRWPKDPVRLVVCVDSHSVRVDNLVTGERTYFAIPEAPRRFDQLESSLKALEELYEKEKEEYGDRLVVVFRRGYWALDAYEASVYGIIQGRAVRSFYRSEQVDSCP